jgi:uncharacterized protein YndB with AHSA1/START domain
MKRISHELRIDAAVADVFKTLSTIDGLRGWYSSRVQGDVAVGGTLKVHADGRPPFSWRISELNSPTATKWDCIEGPGTAPGSTVSFRLSDQDGRTKVQLDFDGLQEDDAAFATCNTLLGVMLGHLKQYAETKVPSPAFADMSHQPNAGVLA